MDATANCDREAGEHGRLGQAHSRVITAILTLLEIGLVGVVIVSLIAIAIVTQLASSLPVSRFHASPDPHAGRMI